MKRPNPTTEERTMRRRSRGPAAIALAAAVVLATAGLAAANHYPEVRRAVKRKDQGVLDGVRRLTYADSTYIDLAAGGCDCLELTCDDGHFMLSCGGEIDPYDSGILTASRRTSRETCLVCGCAAYDGVSLRATPVCMGF
jgi:hypothetical protein